MVRNSNDNTHVSISEEDFLRKIEKMYSEHTVINIDQHMEPDFRYSSFWVLDEMTSAREYVDYITGKVETLKENKVVIKTRMMHTPGLLVERSANGLIARMDMMPAGFYKLV